VSDLYDLDAALAEVASDENLNKPFKFMYQGREWEMRPAVDSDARLMANIDLTETQQVMSYFRDLLGEQWDEFPRITFQGALMLIEAYSVFTNGLGAGE
jgi:hypothetical protein